MHHNGSSGPLLIFSHTRHASGSGACSPQAGRLLTSLAGAHALQSKGVLISSKLLDKPKSQRHREAIATAQRRRLAAHRVLQAIEAVHRHSDVTGLAGQGNSALEICVHVQRLGMLYSHLVCAFFLDDGGCPYKFGHLCAW